MDKPKIRFNDDLIDFRFYKHEPERPDGLKSSMLPESYFKLNYAKPKLTPGSWFVDVNGETVTKTDSEARARQLARSLQTPENVVEVRYWEESEAAQDAHYDEKHNEIWSTILYKKERTARPLDAEPADRYSAVGCRTPVKSI